MAYGEIKALAFGDKEVSTLSRLTFLSVFIALSGLKPSDAEPRRERIAAISTAHHDESSTASIMFLFGTGFIWLGLLRREH